MSVAAAVRLYPVRPLRVRPQLFSPENSAAHKEIWMPAPLLKLYSFSVRPLQRTKS